MICDPARSIAKSLVIMTGLVLAYDSIRGHYLVGTRPDLISLAQSPRELVGKLIWNHLLLQDHLFWIFRQNTAGCLGLTQSSKNLTKVALHIEFTW